MSLRLPPLNALRAFEAAARHLSFTRAAEELHVTPAAVGQQVKSLEQHLDVVLFERMNRALRLTDAGQAALPDLQTAFRKLGDAVERLYSSKGGSLVTLTVEPDFAARWLVRRLDRFNQAHPEVDVHLDASLRVFDLAREGVDLAIRYGAGDWSAMRTERLFEDEIFPVCSARLLRGRHPLKRPVDLRHHVLLHEDWGDTDHDYSWRNWLRAAGVEGVDATRGPRFAQHSLLLDAALQGHGVALASRPLVGDDLASGELVRPFGSAGRMSLAFAYYLVWPRSRPERPGAKALREWLVNEAAGQRSLHA